MRVPKQWLFPGSALRHRARGFRVIPTAAGAAGGEVTSSTGKQSAPPRRWVVWVCMTVVCLLFSTLLVAVVAAFLGVDLYSSLFGEGLHRTANCQDYPVGSVSLHAQGHPDWVPMDGRCLLRAEYAQLHDAVCGTTDAHCTDQHVCVPNITGRAVVPHGNSNRHDHVYLSIEQMPAHTHTFIATVNESSPTCSHSHDVMESMLLSTEWSHTHTVGATVRTKTSGGHTHGSVTTTGNDYAEICDEQSPNPYMCRDKRHTTWEGGHSHEYFKYDTEPVVKHSPFIFKNAESCDMDEQSTRAWQQLSAVVDTVAGFLPPQYSQGYGNAKDAMNLVLQATGSCEDCGGAKSSGMCETGTVTAQNGGTIVTDDPSILSRCYPTPDVAQQPPGFDGVSTSASTQATRALLRTHVKRYTQRAQLLRTVSQNSTFTEDLAPVLALMRAHARALKQLAPVVATNNVSVITAGHHPPATQRAVRYDQVLAGAVHRVVANAARRQLSTTTWTCQNAFPTEHNCHPMNGGYAESCLAFEWGTRPHHGSPWDDWAENCNDFAGWERDCFAASKGQRSIDKPFLLSTTGVPLMSGCASGDECCEEFESRDCWPGGAPTDAWGTPTLNRVGSTDASNPGCTTDEYCCKTWGQEKTCNEVFNHVCCDSCTHNLISNSAGVIGTEDCCEEYKYVDSSVCEEWKEVVDYNCNDAFNPPECECVIGGSQLLGLDDCCEAYEQVDTSVCAEWKTVSDTVCNQVFNPPACDCIGDACCDDWAKKDGNTCANWKQFQISCEHRLDCDRWYSDPCYEWNYVWTTCHTWQTTSVCNLYGCAPGGTFWDPCPSWECVGGWSPVSCQGRVDCTCGSNCCLGWNSVRTTCKTWRMTPMISCEGEADVANCPTGNSCNDYVQVNDYCREWKSPPAPWSCEGVVDAVNCPAGASCNRYEQTDGACIGWKKAEPFSCEGHADVVNCPTGGSCVQWKQERDYCETWKKCTALELCGEPDTCTFPMCAKADKCFVRTGCNDNSPVLRESNECGCAECYPYNENTKWRYELDMVASGTLNIWESWGASVDTYGSTQVQCMQKEDNFGDLLISYFECFAEAVSAAFSTDVTGYGCREGSAIISDLHVERQNSGYVVQGIAGLEHDLLTYMDEWLFAPHYGLDQETADERHWPKRAATTDHTDSDASQLSVDPADARPHYAETMDGGAACPLNRCVWAQTVEGDSTTFACMVPTKTAGGDQLHVCLDPQGHRVHTEACVAPNTWKMDDQVVGESTRVEVKHPLHDDLFPYCRSYGSPTQWDDIKNKHAETLHAVNTQYNTDFTNEDFTTRHTHPCEGTVHTHPWYHKHDVYGSCQPMSESGGHTHTAEGTTSVFSASTQGAVCTHSHKEQVLTQSTHEQQPIDTTPPYVQHPHYVRVKGCN